MSRQICASVGLAFAMIEGVVKSLFLCFNGNKDMQTPKIYKGKTLIDFFCNALSVTKVGSKGEKSCQFNEEKKEKCSDFCQFWIKIKTKQNFKDDPSVCWSDYFCLLSTIAHFFCNFGNDILKS